MDKRIDAGSAFGMTEKKPGMEVVSDLRDATPLNILLAISL